MPIHLGPGVQVLRTPHSGINHVPLFNRTCLAGAAPVVLVSAPVLRMNAGTMCTQVRKQLLHSKVDAVERRKKVYGQLRSEGHDGLELGP
jgi:hypothetical protein